MVKNIVSHKYPQRIIKFKKMVNEVWFKTVNQKNQKRISLANYSLKKNESDLWLSNDSERWEKFQEEFQGEFEDKIQLIGKIRGKKREYEVFYLLQDDYFL